MNSIQLLPSTAQDSSASIPHSVLYHFKYLLLRQFLALQNSLKVLDLLRDDLGLQGAVHLRQTGCSTVTNLPIPPLLEYHTVLEGVKRPSSRMLMYCWTSFFGK